MWLRDLRSNPDPADCYGNGSTRDVLFGGPTPPGGLSEVSLFFFFFSINPNVK
jgi:hypothetical protein